MTHNVGMASATITRPQAPATATTVDQPSRDPAKELTKHIEQGKALLSQARLVGDINDYQGWKVARKAWIELTAETLRHLYGSEEADSFESVASARARGGRWQTGHKRDSTCMEVAVDGLVALQGRSEIEQEPAVDSDPPTEPTDEPVHACDAQEPFPCSLEQELEELARAAEAPPSEPAAELGPSTEPEELSSEPAADPEHAHVLQEPSGDAEVVPRSVRSSLPTTATASLTPDRMRQVFLVHGRSEKWKRDVAGLLERAAPNEVTVVNEPSNARGDLVRAEGPRYAVIVLTADDVGGPRLDSDQEPYFSPRACQSVVFEMGVLVAALGLGRVCALYEDGVELPIDLGGMSYIRLDPARTWQFKLLLKLRSAGFDCDLNGLAPV